METGECTEPGVCAAVDVHYLSTGEARAPAVLAALRTCWPTRTAMVPQVPAYRPGESCRREVPPLRAVLGDLSGLGQLVVGGYADLDPSGRPGLGAQAHAEFGIAVIGVAKTGLRTATHAVPVLRGYSVRPFHQAIPGTPPLFGGFTDPLSGWCGGDRADVESPCSGYPQ